MKSLKKITMALMIFNDFYVNKKDEIRNVKLSEEYSKNYFKDRVYGTFGVLMRDSVRCQGSLHLPSVTHHIFFSLFK